jgi:hypothetical protein
VVVDDPANGSLTLNPDGSFSYTPTANYSGSDSFTYKANDGGLDSNVATVTIAVGAVNDAPTAANDSYSTAEDTPLTVAAPGVLGNDSDPEGSTLTAVLGTGPTKGTLALNPDGSFTYTPGAGFSGTDNFTYRASDGMAVSNTATVSISVTAGPPPPTYTLSLTSTAGGSATGGGSYAPGSVATLAATPEAGFVFTGWTLDGQFVGWASPLTLTMDGDHAAVATFAMPPAFPDVAAGTPDAEAIRQLAARGIIRGYADGRFGPGDTTLRAQMAALIARAMGWDSQDDGNPFPDRGTVDADLWRNVGTLAYYGVARGYPDGTFKPTNEVLSAQVISFITRAMVARGHWQAQPDDLGLYPNVPAGSGHREDLATFVSYVGGIPGATATGEPWAGWDEPSTRAWHAQVLWQALDSYWGADRTP